MPALIQLINWQIKNLTTKVDCKFIILLYRIIRFKNWVTFFFIDYNSSIFFLAEWRGKVYSFGKVNNMIERDYISVAS